MKKILRSTQYVTLAMAKDNQPYLVSLSHGYDEERNCIYVHCAKDGKKLEYLRSNNAVWGQALQDYGYKQGECTHIYVTVQFSGKVSLIEDRDEKWYAMELMIRQLDNDTETLIERWTAESLDNTVIGRIDIEYMIGKKSKEVTI